MAVAVPEPHGEALGEITDWAEFAGDLLGARSLGVAPGGTKMSKRRSLSSQTPWASWPPWAGCWGCSGTGRSRAGGCGWCQGRLSESDI